MIDTWENNSNKIFLKDCRKDPEISSAGKRQIQKMFIVYNQGAPRKI